MRRSTHNDNNTILKSDQADFRKTDDYPDNLILALEILPSSNEEIHRQQVEGLDIVLGSLMEREREILIARFRDQKTQRECAEIHQISYQRVWAIEKKALEKLKHPTRTALIAFGPEQVKRYETLRVEIEVMERHAEMLRKQIEQMEKSLHHNKKWSRNTNLESKKDWASISIDDIGLSPKAHYRLSHQQIYTLYDLSKYSRQELLAIRQMGEVTVDEIVKKAAKFGLHIIEK